MGDRKNMLENREDSPNKGECLKPEDISWGKKRFALKLSALLFTTSTIAALILLSIILAGSLYWFSMELQKLEGEAKRIDRQMTDKDAQMSYTKKGLEEKDALLKEKIASLDSTKNALENSSQREKTLNEKLNTLQRENDDLIRMLNATYSERDQYALQTGNLTTEYDNLMGKYGSLLIEKAVEEGNREAERTRCENIKVKVSPQNPRATDDFTLTFSYGDGRPASNIPVFVRTEFEINSSRSIQRRFHLIDEGGQVSVKGKEPSFPGSGETSVLLNCGKNQYYMRFYLYTKTQDIIPRVYVIEKIDYSHYT